MAEANPDTLLAMEKAVLDAEPKQADPPIAGEETETDLPPAGAVFVNEGEDDQAVTAGPPPAGAVFVESEPSGAPGPPAEEERGIWDKISDRFLGNDVEDDPLQWPRMGTTVAGALGGAVAVAKSGAALGALTGPAAPIASPALGIVGGLVGGATGAFFGAQAPEAVLEFEEALGTLEEGRREEIGLSPEELQTVAEGEALLDLATGGGLTIVRSGGRLAASLLTGARKEVAEKAARQGIDMTPVQVGDRILGRGFVSVFGRMPLLGGGVIRRRGAKAEEQMRKAVTGLAERTGPITDASDLSTRIFGDAKTLLKDINKRFGERYNALFARAEESGTQVIPRGTIEKADQILKKLKAQTPVSATGEALPPGQTLSSVIDFIEKNVGPLRAVTPEGTIVAKQSLRQMDGLLSVIDQHIASLEPGQRRFALSLMNQIRQAAQKDVLENMRGVDASEITAEMRAIDKDFSNTMSQLFETSTAKRFASVEKRGLRAIEFDRKTRIPVDQLARIVVNLNSPQALDELSRLVTPDTMRRIAAHTLDDAMQMALKTDGSVGQLDIALFAKRLGWDGANEARKRAVSEMLSKSGSPVTPTDLDDIITAGRELSGVEIPNVSTFIARRGVIGGLQGVINGLLPGLALFGGAREAAKYSGSAALGTILFIGGSHLFARIIANPNSARALHKVFDKEVTTLTRRKALSRVLVEGIHEMRDSDEITADTAEKLKAVSERALEMLARQYKSMTE